MKNKAKMKKGLVHVGYALATVNVETNAVTYEAPVYLPTLKAGGREYTATPRGDSQKIYADSTAVYGDTVNDGYDIALTLLAMTDDINAVWLNERKDSKGIAEYADGEEYPYFALILSEDTTDGAGKTSIYYFCQCSGRPERSGKTREGGTFDFAFPQYSITSTPRLSDTLVKYEIPGTDLLDELPEPEKTATPPSENVGN